MPPSFSKIAPAFPVLSGLRCGHADCYALFTTFKDSEEHAVKAHSGNFVAFTCNIQEELLESGQVRLYRVLDADGEQKFNQILRMLTRTPERSVGVGVDGPRAIRKENGQLPTELLRSSTLGEQSSTLLKNNPTGMALVETPPAWQSTVSTRSSQGLSRQSTEPIIDIPSSSSSLPSLSLSSIGSSVGDAGEQKLHRILDALQEMVGECRICWAHQERTRPHRTYKCTTRICSSRNWESFKVGLQFPKNVVCYFCLSPYGPPFNHPRASPGTRPSADLCEYPDVLKELVYVLYQDEALRQKIFTKLDIAQPSSLTLYQRFIGKKQRDGIFGAYEVVNTYLELRESKEL